MKLLFCYRFGILGGVCTQLIHRVRALRSLPNIEAHLAFMEDHGISQTLAGWDSVYFARRGSDLRRLVERERYDAVGVIDTPEFLHAMDHPLVRSTILCEVHTTVPASLEYLEEPWWRADALVVPSRSSAELLRERTRKRDIPIHIIPNGIELTMFSPRSVLPSKRPIVLWVGKLDEHKDWRRFINVARALHQSDDGPELWLAGGETASITRADELFRAAAEAGISERLRWLERVEYEAMARLYSIVAASGGCQLITSRSESFCMSALEALLCGCPVVAPPVGALPELAAMAPHLTLAESREVAVLARAVRAALQSRVQPDTRELVRAHDIRRAAERYVSLVDGLRAGRQP